MHKELMLNRPRASPWKMKYHNNRRRTGSFLRPSSTRRTRSLQYACSLDGRSRLPWGCCRRDWLSVKRVSGSTTIMVSLHRSCS
ncbi:hypothetical protein BD311DRAFT_456637 [Dichomitus squalens]|uniref:Uncharacterized protein n=1 Tax=Dichomitus squalens TaxID=114155 RepID=A0A4Q9MFM7_9APHY|nr:hypothetical protein BD311DRAFT_456637 [Dichomitus squalens]